MTPTLARCSCHLWPAVECMGGTEPPPRIHRPAADATGIVLPDGDSDQIARLAEATVVAAFAVAGGVVALAFGVLRTLLGGQR